MADMDEDVVQQLMDFYEELPTLVCGEGGCGNCSARFLFSCAPLVPGEKAKARADAWEEDTLPGVPMFLQAGDFDDDYIAFPEEMGGEG